MPEMQPRSAGAILADAFNLYKKNAVLLIITAAVAMGPIFLVKDAIMAVAIAPAASSRFEADANRLKDLDRQLQAAQARGAPPAEIEAIAAQQMAVAMETAKRSVGALAGIGAMLLGMLIGIPLMMLAMYLAQAALTVVVNDRAQNGTMTWQQAWGVVGHEIGPLLVTSFFVAVGVAVGLCFLLLPGMIFGFLAAFVIPVVLLEKKSGIEAIKRSIQLVRSDWLRVAIVLIVFGILQAVASWIGGLFIPSRFFFLHTLLGDLVSIAVLPIPIVGLVLLYQDMPHPQPQPQLTPRTV